MQFLAQTIGIIVLRTRRPDFPRPFRMWLYPLPAILAFIGYVYTVVMRPKSIESIRLALLVVAAFSYAIWIGGLGRAFLELERGSATTRMVRSPSPT